MPGDPINIVVLGSYDPVSCTGRRKASEFLELEGFLRKQRGLSPQVHGFGVTVNLQLPGELVKLRVLDIESHPKPESLLSEPNTAVIIAYDPTRTDIVDHLRQNLNLLDRYPGASPLLCTMIAATNSDAVAALVDTHPYKHEQVVSNRDAVQQFAPVLGALACVVDFKTGTGVVEMLRSLAQKSLDLASVKDQGRPANLESHPNESAAAASARGLSSFFGSLFKPKSAAAAPVAAEATLPVSFSRIAEALSVNLSFDLYDYTDLPPHYDSLTVGDQQSADAGAPHFGARQ